jgi:cytochrome c
MNKIILLTTVLMCCTVTAKAAKFDKSESLAEYTPTLTEDFKQLLRNADVKAGEAYFSRKCGQCHDHEKTGAHSKGPLLWNVLGRKSASMPGFEYSEGMKNAGHTWSYATLNYYLTRTDRAVPGRSMNFRGIKKDPRRANLLLFIRTINDNPPPLP